MPKEQIGKKVVNVIRLKWIKVVKKLVKNDQQENEVLAVDNKRLRPRRKSYGHSKYY